VQLGNHQRGSHMALLAPPGTKGPEVGLYASYTKMTKTFEASPHASQVCGRIGFVATGWLWRTDATRRSGLNSHRREALWGGTKHNRVTRAVGWRRGNQPPKGSAAE
jgi:hypothetical protein